MKNNAIIAIGSNIPPRKNYIKKAYSKIASIPSTRIRRKSRLYETEPIGGPKQGLFLNGAIEILTSCTPKELLLRLIRIEKSLHRVRAMKNGPRTIDLDIIFYDNLCEKDRDLEIPHPRFRERGFVLIPLNDIIPGFVDPVSNLTVADLLERWRFKENRAHETDADHSMPRGDEEAL